MPGEPKHDAFVASMTFANKSSHQDCICDECGATQVPAAVREAVQRHLLKRKLELPIFEGSKRIHITQRRELVKRDGGFSVWKLVLPCDVRSGDPIVEYRNNHRILFIEKIPKSSVVFSIGKGIIGSAAEENSRKKVDWDEGGAYFFPRQHGIACGWIHKEDGSENNDSDVASNSADGDMEVVIYVLKVSSDVVLNDGEEMPPNKPQWVKKMQLLFSNNIGSISSEGNEDGNTSKFKIIEGCSETQNPMEGIHLTEEDSERIREIIRLVNEKRVE